MTPELDAAIARIEANWGSKPTPTEAVRLLRFHAFKHNLQPGDNNFEDAANVIERLLKAYEEAQVVREEALDMLAAGSNLVDCANAIVGADTFDPDAAEAFDMFIAAKGKWRLHAHDLRALLHPTPTGAQTDE